MESYTIAKSKGVKLDCPGRDSHLRGKRSTT
jgi:hypothetical protein